VLKTPERSLNTTEKDIFYISNETKDGKEIQILRQLTPKSQLQDRKPKQIYTVINRHQPEKEN
jgi:hypothetical protein